MFSRLKRKGLSQQLLSLSNIGMTKSVLLLPFAFVLGGLVGYWGANDDLHSLRTKAEVSASAKKKSASGFGSFAQLVQIPETAKKRRPHKRNASKPKVAEVKKPLPKQKSVEAPPEVVQEVPQTNVVAETSAPKPAPPPTSPEDLRARIDEAAELWRTRADLARAKALEKLKLDEQGEELFDEALNKMNEKLRESMQTIADMLANEEAMTPEISVRLMGDMAITLADTYDSVGAVVGEDQRGDVSSLQLFDFVDPSVAEPLIPVQGKLDGAFPGRGGRR